MKDLLNAITLLLLGALAYQVLGCGHDPSQSQDAGTEEVVIGALCSDPWRWRCVTDEPMMVVCAIKDDQSKRWEAVFFCSECSDIDGVWCAP